MARVEMAELMPRRGAHHSRVSLQVAKNVAMPTVPGTPVAIYALPEPKVERSQLVRAAKALGLAATLKSGRFEEDAATFGYSEEPRALRVFRASGGIRYADLSRWQRDNGDTNLMLDIGPARTQAKRLLRQLKLDDFAHARFQRAAPLNVAEGNAETRVVTERVIDVALVYQRMIGRLPVDGPGGRAVVYFDGKGVTGVDVLWRTRGSKVRSTPLLPPEFAIEQVEQRLRAIGAEQVQLRELRLAYFEFGWSHRQRYLQPAYIAFLTLIGAEGVRTARIEVIAASPRPGAGLTPPIKRAGRLRARPDAPAPREPRQTRKPPPAIA
jgi:hypothetical protein